MPPSASTTADGREPKSLGVPAQIAGFSIGGAASLGLLYIYLSATWSSAVDTIAIIMCGVLSAATVVTACCIAVRLKRTQGRLTAAKHVAEEVRAQREAELSMFHVAVNNMSQGLCMFGADRKLIMSNTRYARIYRMPPDQLRPGMSLDEIVALRFAVGNKPKMGEAAYAAKLAEINQRRQAGEFVVEQEDGRVFLLGHMPLASGGWVARTRTSPSGGGRGQDRAHGPP